MHNDGGHKRKYTPRRPRRILILKVGFITALAIVVGRIIDIQLVYGSNLLQNAKKIQDVHRTVLAPRGAILDASGQKLAYDIPAYIMDLKLSGIQNKTMLANDLSNVLHLSQASVLPLVNESHPWIQWPRPITEPQKAQISQDLASLQDSQDVTFTETEQRFYPFGNFASDVLGFVDQNGNGKMGIELQYNHLLAGHNGQISYTQDGAGFPIPGTMKVQKAAQPGDSVQLTINQDIQAYVNHEMNNLVQKFHPAHATMIVMNPNNGAILAMSSRPNFNPNHYWTASSQAFTNWGVSSSYEPGSTFKVPVLAAALQTNSIQLNQTFMSGQTTISGKTIHDWNYFGWGRITFLKALEYSSNVGFSKIAERLGWPNLLHYIRLFGFMQKTGIDLPGEASSILFPKSEEGKLQLATTGFGQGIAVTPLQLIRAVAVVANGGTLYRPYVVSRILSPNGTVVKNVSPHVVRSGFISSQVLATVKNAMVLDVSKGIDNAANIPGYEVAGKTGTAQVVNPKTGKFYNSRYITSFIGFAPAWHPRVIVYCAVDWPKTPVYNTWGNTTATPAARAVLKFSMNYFHVSPRINGSTKKNTPTSSAASTVKYVTVPNMVGETVQNAKKTLKSMGFVGKTLGGGGMVMRQWPEAGVQIPQQTPIYILAQSTKTSPVTMPNVLGLTMRQVDDLLSLLGLRFLPSGSGFAISQSIASGQVIHPGESVNVEFKPPT